MYRTVIVSSTANFYLDIFPAGDIELSLIWDYASCFQTPEASSDTASKLCHYGGGMCSVTPITEQHSKSQARIASKLSQIAQQGIRAAGACQYGHSYLQCHLPINGSGQDEKISHDNAIQKRGWKYKSFFILLWKGAGVGLMVSGIVCRLLSIWVPNDSG